jgi:hypothetical protein
MWRHYYDETEERRELVLSALADKPIWSEEIAEVTGLRKNDVLIILRDEMRSGATPGIGYFNTSEVTYQDEKSKIGKLNRSFTRMLEDHFGIPSIYAGVKYSYFKLRDIELEVFHLLRKDGSRSRKYWRKNVYGYVTEKINAAERELKKLLEESGYDPERSIRASKRLDDMFKM